MSLAEHRAVGDPASCADPDQERNVGLARAYGRQRADVTAEARFSLLIEFDERRIHENGIAARCAAVGIADQRSLDLSDRSGSPDRIPAGEHEAANVEIDLALEE